MLWRTSLRPSLRTPPAGFILPCQPLLVYRPPAGSDCLHEIKHDGYRILARKEQGRVTLWTRHGTNFTDRLPKVAEAVCSLAADSALIDGEAVTFRSDGHSDFAALRTKAGSAQACHVAFDLLSLNGEDLRQRPLAERRDDLSRLVHGVDGILFSEALSAEGALVFAKACKQAGPGGDRLEACRQPVSERDKPAMAEVQEPGLCARFPLIACIHLDTVRRVLLPPFKRVRSLVARALGPEGKGENSCSVDPS
jgi:bifunctional non-homologous end joining protein LigD